MDNPCLSHAQTPPVQTNAASDTKCSRNQRKFILNEAQEQQFNEFIRCKKIYYLLALLLVFAGGEAASGVRLRMALAGDGSSPLRHPGWGWLSQETDVTIASSIATARRRRRKLDAPTKFEHLWPGGIVRM